MSHARYPHAVLLGFDENCSVELYAVGGLGQQSSFNDFAN